MNRSASRAILQLIADVANQDRRSIAAFLLLAFGTALAEGFGILSLVPVTALAVSPDSMRHVPVLGELLANIAADRRLLVALVAFLLLMSLRALLVFARGRTQAAIQARYDSGLKMRAVASLAHRPWNEAALIGRDGMQALLHHDVPRAVVSLQYAVALLVAGLLLLVQVVLAAFLSVPMTIAALGLILVGAPFARAYFRRAFVSGASISQGLADSTEAGNRLHDELKSATAQGTVPLFLDRYRSTLDWLRGASVELGRDQATLTALSGLSAALAAAMLVWGGVQWLALPLPTVLALLLLFARMSGPAQTLVTTGSALAAHAPSFTAIRDRLGALPRSFPETPGAAAIAPLPWKRLQLTDVALDIGNRQLLRRVDVAIGAGEWVAIEGPSGAGKTSLLDLIAGLHRPSTGEITVDGQQLEGATLSAWRRGLSYVGQDELIYAASLRVNIGTGVQALDPDLLDRALYVSGLDSLAASWPEGLDLPLTDRGRRLSGGERQRVGIARALVRAPRLLILDEATAAMDLAAEAALFDRLRALPERPAVLLVSHRPQTLARCDRRVTIEGGSVR